MMPDVAIYVYSDADADADQCPANLTLRSVQPNASRRLMRRYYLLQQAREAEMIGVMVGTLSASYRDPMLKALKALVRRAGRKHYVFVMGKLNAAKLANFIDIGAYVLIGSAEHSLLDSKDFYRPVVTPYELYVALTPEAEWTGRLILDYARLLPQLHQGDADSREQDGRGARYADGGSTDEEEPQFSMLTGRLISRRRADDVGDQGGHADGQPTSGALALAGQQDGGVLAQRGQYAVAVSGADALSRREFRGLEPRIGEHEPARVVEGRSGVASSFDNEGGQQGAIPCTDPALLDNSLPALPLPPTTPADQPNTDDGA
jgi:diphthamide biosynthesis protein 2